MVAHGSQAAYFVEMDKTGNKGEGSNTAGALFGTGYCDAQCPADIKFVNGLANTNETRVCCNEFDVWGGNKQAQAVAIHSCETDSLFVYATDQECGLGEFRYQGACDGPGCDFNGYRMGSKNFYGPEMTVDSTQTFTLVAQFITSDDTDDGDLQEIKRFFVQGGTVIPDTTSTYTESSSISDEYCAQLTNWTGDKNHHEDVGGLKMMGEAFDRGMVLALSLWDDASGGLQWLDGILGNEGEPGALRGRCGEDAIRNVDTLRDTYGTATITYSNIRFGPIRTTTTKNAGVNSTASLGTGDNADNAGVNATASPGVNTTAAPGVNATASPGVNATASSGVNATASPGVNATASPGVNATASSGVNATASPGVNTAASPVDEDETVQTDVPATYAPTANDQDADPAVSGSLSVNVTRSPTSTLY